LSPGKRLENLRWTRSIASISQYYNIQNVNIKRRATPLYRTTFLNQRHFRFNYLFCL